MYELTVTSGFSSAHNLRGYEGACENLHGHNWKVEATIRAQGLNDIGIALDFKVLKKELNTIVQRLDHRYLNELIPFDRVNATAENIARYIFDELSRRLNKGNIKVACVRVWESEGACAAFLADG